MWAFVKSFATYRTIRMAAVISSALTLDSLSAENSTVTVVGTEIGQNDAGNWLVIDGGVYSITGVKPQTDRTLLTLTSPPGRLFPAAGTRRANCKADCRQLHRSAADRTLD